MSDESIHSADCLKRAEEVRMKDRQADERARAQITRMPIELYYGRAGRAVRFRMKAVTTDEIRAVIVGLWLILDERARDDMIDELEHYAQDDPHHVPPPASLAIEAGYRRGGRLS